VQLYFYSPSNDFPSTVAVVDSLHRSYDGHFHCLG